MLQGSLTASRRRDDAPPMHQGSLTATARHDGDSPKGEKDDTAHRVSYKDQMRYASEDPQVMGDGVPPRRGGDPPVKVGLEEAEQYGDTPSQVPVADAVLVSSRLLGGPAHDDHDDDETREERDRRLQQLQRQVDQIERIQAESSNKKKCPTSMTVLGAAVGVLVLAGIIAATATCGSGNCQRGTANNNNNNADSATRPATLSPTLAPTRLVWQKVGQDLFGLTEYPFGPGYGQGGMFGSVVSLSKDGSVLAVGFGENGQFWYTRRARATTAARPEPLSPRALAVARGAYVAKLYRCGAGSGGTNDTTTACVEIGAIIDLERNSSYLSVSVAGDGSRLALAYDNVLQVHDIMMMSTTVTAPDQSNDFTSAPSVLSQQQNAPLRFANNTNPAGVALSEAGDILAVLERDGDLVAVYEYQEDGQDWQQLGQPILRRDPEVNGSRTELQSLSLSSTGRAVAIGANVGSAQNCAAGINVRVFIYGPLLTSAGEEDWSQIGADIETEVYESLLSDQTIALAANGTILAIGSNARNANDNLCQNTFTRRPDSGRVRVFQLSEGQQWVPMGGMLSGVPNTGDKFGVSVSLSNNGMTLVVGSSSHDSESGLESGKTQVYEYDDGIDAWVQLGQDIVGNGGDGSGSSVAISGDGTMVAVGSPSSAAAGEDSGTVRVFNLGGSSS